MWLTRVLMKRHHDVGLARICVRQAAPATNTMMGMTWMNQVISQPWPDPKTLMTSKWFPSQVTWGMSQCAMITAMVPAATTTVLAPV